MYIDALGATLMIYHLFMCTGKKSGSPSDYVNSALRIGTDGTQAAMFNCADLFFRKSVAHIARCHDR